MTALDDAKDRAHWEHPFKQWGLSFSFIVFIANCTYVSLLLLILLIYELSR